LQLGCPLRGVQPGGALMGQHEYAMAHERWTEEEYVTLSENLHLSKQELSDWFKRSPGTMGFHRDLVRVALSRGIDPAELTNMSVYYSLTGELTAKGLRPNPVPIPGRFCPHCFMELALAATTHCSSCGDPLPEEGVSS